MSLTIATKKKLRILCTAVTGMIAIVVTGGLLLHHGYAKLKRTQFEVEKLGREVYEQRERNKSLFEETQRFKNNRHAIEKIAREQLQLANPDDIIIKLNGRAKKETPEPPPPNK